MEIKPLDFQPLTSLPWKEKPAASLEETLKRIFLESDPAIRYPVLAAYLKHIPAGQLEAAFDHCIRLEGTQRPHDLISFFLPIWAERAPPAAWRRVEPLFQLQDTNWLAYDSWGEEKIAFRNLDAMRASSFWLDPRWLENFLAGLKRSQLSPDEKKSLRDSFMSRWTPIYESPPSEHPTAEQGGYELDAPGLLEAFGIPPEDIVAEIGHDVEEKHAAAIRVLLRRWLVWKPDKAVLVASIGEKLEEIPDELLLLWQRVAPGSLMDWIEANQGIKKLPFRAMGMVLGQIDSERRQRWLARVRAGDPDDFATLLYHWAAWEPNAAMKEAIVSQDPYAISRAAEGIVYGFNQGTPNTTLHGLSFIRDFDLTLLPLKDRQEMFSQWHILKEQWGDIDVGEAARYGLHMILATNYAPRENLIKLFSGDDAFGSDSDMIDRTFCALRMWAALQPEPMKAWIATQPDPEMRKALTWLLEHPWGTGKP